MGALSDKIGRRTQLAASGILALLSAAPLYIWLVATPSVPKLLFVELWFSIIFASSSGAMVPFLTEIMPASVRATGYSLAFSLATAIFGGFTPAIVTALIRVTGSRAMPALWLSFAAILALVATTLLKSVPEQSSRPVDPVYELAEGKRYKEG
jgi:MHS family citrate/tricarballylate:H+ symporter-like MFS transporter